MALFRIIPAGDVALPSGTTRLISGAEAVRQKMACRFKFWLAEWFLDQRLGVPFRRDVLVKNPDMLVVRSVFRQIALGTPGVVSLSRFELVFDPVTRLLSFDFEAQLNSDEILTVRPDDTLFIITDLQEAA